jgi:hypothetical protein
MTRLLRFVVSLPFALTGFVVVVVATLFVWIGSYFVDFANWLNEHE